MMKSLILGGQLASRVWANADTGNSQDQEGLENAGPWQEALLIEKQNKLFRIALTSNL